MTKPLEDLSEKGQSVWLDFISRDLIKSGKLQNLIDNFSVVGMTSNPTIFQKAIETGSDYDPQLQQLFKDGKLNPDDLFLELAVTDIQAAADVLRPVYDKTGGGDGFVSIELPPSTAHDTALSVTTAKYYWEKVNRPNIFIKVPGTDEGAPAVELLIAEGININITLLFSIAAYARVIEAYLKGLEARVDKGLTLDIHSVASFFVSRVDTLADKLLQERLLANPQDQGQHLLGKTAIANAKLAYQLFEQQFSTPRWKVLEAKGAKVQRPLWASTSTKNPAYRDVMYVEGLEAPNTVNTMPLATIEAFQDHGVVGSGDAACTDYPQAQAVIEELAGLGIKIDDITAQLLDEGVQSFADSYNSLVGAIAAKVDGWLNGYGGRQTFNLASTGPTYDQQLDSFVEVVKGVWTRDPNTWKPGDPAAAKVIDNRLGWLTVADQMKVHVPKLQEFADEIKSNFDHVVLLGMGGSSLCPEVIRTSFVSCAGFPELHVLDTTDSQAILDLEGQLPIDRTLFVVASKSGGTLETLSHFAYFFEKTGEIGKQFIAITDPGSPLETLATEKGFLRTFANPQDIGGRYSALSYFGLVPAALIGVDLNLLLGRATVMEMRCHADSYPAHNCGMTLGAAISVAHDLGQDKVTILTSKRIAAFSLWAEQLIAESTGKEGRGIIPIGDEPVGNGNVYGHDRLFVALDLKDDEVFTAQIDALATSGFPVISLQLEDVYDLGAEFFRWEMATAIAGAHLQIDAFDEPNVQESKDNTKTILSTYLADGHFPDPPVPTIEGNFTEELVSFVSQAKPESYVALMAYVTPTNSNYQSLQRLRVALRDRFEFATTLGFGPRFLHSTGQLHKGGPNEGVFVQITADDSADVQIPNQKYTFNVLKSAQAAGDLTSLVAHGRSVVHLHIKGDLRTGINDLAHAVGQLTGAH